MDHNDIFMVGDLIKLRSPAYLKKLIKFHNDSRKNHPKIVFDYKSWVHALSHKEVYKVLDIVNYHEFFNSGPLANGLKFKIGRGEGALPDSFFSIVDDKGKVIHKGREVNFNE